MADAALTKIAIAEETTFGTAATTGFQLMRYTRESLKGRYESIQSEEIDPTRQPVGRTRSNVAAEGSLDVEWSNTAAAASPGNGYDMLLEGAMMSDWSAVSAQTTLGIDIENPQTVAGENRFDLDDQNVGNTAFTGVVNGQVLKLVGYSTNGTIYTRVRAVSGGSYNAGLIQVVGLRSTGAAITAETATTGINLYHSYLRSGSTKKSYTIVKFLDLATDEYQVFTGMRVSTFDLRVTPQAIVSGSFGFTGKLKETTTGAPTGYTTATAKWSTPRLNAISHVSLRQLSAYTDLDAVSAERWAEWSIRWDNRPRYEPEIGVQGSTDIGISNPVCEGTLNVYLADGALDRALEADTAYALSFLLSDGTRDRYLTLPYVRLTDGRTLAEGNDRSILVQLNWAAEPDPENGISINWDRF